MHEFYFMHEFLFQSLKNWSSSLHKLVILNADKPTTDQQTDFCTTHLKLCLREYNLAKQMWPFW